MTRVCSIFSQFLQLFPRLEFEIATRKHNAERHARGITCWVSSWPCFFASWGTPSHCGRFAGLGGFGRETASSGVTWSASAFHAGRRQRAMADLPNGV